MKKSIRLNLIPDITLTTAFVAIIFMPIVGMLTKRIPEYPATDNRKLAVMPVLPPIGLSAYKRYIGEYEAFFNDNFGSRNSLIRLSSLISFHLLNTSPVPHVVIGKNGFLFFNSLENGISLPDFEGKVPFLASDLELIRNKMSALQAEFDRRKIHFIVVLAPNKHSIYPEMLPDQILTKKGQETRADQLESFFPRIGINFIDLRSVLVEEKRKSSMPLYYLTDTHWNPLGAFVGYEAIADRIQKVDPSFHRLYRRNFVEKIFTNSGEGDLASMASMKGMLKDFDISLTSKVNSRAVSVTSEYGDRSSVFKVSDSRLSRLLLFGDSFSGSLVPFLAEGFSRSVFLWQHYIDFSIVDKEKPDIVILEFVERFSDVTR